jgi:hypothetical protein
MIAPPAHRFHFTSLVRQLGGWFGYQCEHIFVLVLEGFYRLFNRLDPRVYFESLRIISIHDGSNTKTSSKFFVLVIFCPDALPAFTRTIIDAVAKSHFNLVIVSNAELSPELAHELRGTSSLVIGRKNVGRDFGAYKDGIQIVLRRYHVERLVIANDSVFYLNDGLDQLLASLDSAHDLIGVSEVYEHHYHVAAFLMSFSRRVLESKAFRAFWRHYRPLGSRRWAIFQGEGALSAMLLGAGFRPHILYRAVHLRSYLKDDESVLRLLPLQLRAWLAGVGEPRSTTLQHKLTMALKWLSGVSRARLRGVDLVIDEVMHRNQMHAAGFLFRKFMALPLLKRDLYYRDVHALDDIAAILADQPPALREAIMEDLRVRGNSAGLGSVGRLLHRHS